MPVINLRITASGWCALELENWSWSRTRINQLNPRPLAQNVPQPVVVAFKLSVGTETTISRSSTHKSFNVWIYYTWLSKLFDFPQKKENVILSRAVYFLKPIVYSERPWGAIISLSPNSFYLTEGSSERRESESEREKKPWSLSNAKIASIESSNWWPQRGLKDLSPLFKSPVFAYLMT